MFNNNWVTQKLVNEHQRQLAEKADRLRQAQNAQQEPQVRRSHKVLAKLRAEMNNL